MSKGICISIVRQKSQPVRGRVDKGTGKIIWENIALVSFKGSPICMPDLLYGIHSIMTFRFSVYSNILFLVLYWYIFEGIYQFLQNGKTDKERAKIVTLSVPLYLYYTATIIHSAFIVLLRRLCIFKMQNKSYALLYSKVLILEPCHPVLRFTPKSKAPTLQKKLLP